MLWSSEFLFLLFNKFIHGSPPTSMVKTPATSVSFRKRLRTGFDLRSMFSTMLSTSGNPMSGSDKPSDNWIRTRSKMYVDMMNGLSTPQLESDDCVTRAPPFKHVTFTQRSPAVGNCFAGHVEHCLIWIN